MAVCVPPATTSSGTLAKMETIFTGTSGRRQNGAGLLLLVLAAAYVLAVVHGVVTIDVARDMYWAIEIAQGRALPLLGPPVGSIEVLAAWWYYLGALAIWLGGSVTGYFAWLGLLAASKYLLIYRAGLRIGDRRFAVLLLAAAAAPGIASYQLFGVGHTQLLEATVWGCVLLALRLCQPGAVLSRRWVIVNAGLLGACAALALHAHPTAVLLAPWLTAVLVALDRRHRATAAVAAVIGGGLVFLPYLLARVVPTLVIASAAINAPGVSGFGGTLSGMVPLAANLLWQQPLAVLDTSLNAPNGLATATHVVWAMILLATACGGLLALTDIRWRWWCVAAAATLVLVLAATALLRDHTPFYMLYVALPPATLLLAISWAAAERIRAGRAVSTAVTFAVVALHLLVVGGTISAAREGLVKSYLPLHSNMRDITTVAHEESVLPALIRDEVAARLLCGQDGEISLHGDVASFAMGLGHELQLRCAERIPQVHIGGLASPQIWLPADAWAAMNIEPQAKLRGWGLAPASAVATPASPLPPVSGRNYPPRLDLMLAAAQAKPWTTSLTTDAGAALVVSNLLPTSPIFAVNVTRDGVAQTAALRFANTTVYRCTGCAAGAAHWSVQVQGGLPETTSIAASLPLTATLPR